MEPTAVLYAMLLLGPIYIVGSYLFARYRVARSGADADAAGEADDAVDRDAGNVTCPNCGAENELGYTYCYNCIGELPGGVSTATSRARPRQRGIR
ncbi:zinc ribbon domain-containing protein [Halopiger thermotolerans]